MALQVEGLVEVKAVQVQVLSPALKQHKDLRRNSRESLFVLPLSFWGQIGDTGGFTLRLRRWSSMRFWLTILREGTNMASLELRGNRYRVVFRLTRRKYQHPLNTDDARKAEAALVRLEENLELLRRGRLEPPKYWDDLPFYLLSDGKLDQPVRAYTGARRSEMMRCLFNDVSFDGWAITLREKKREQGTLTTRRVRMANCLAEILRDWMGEGHPGWQYMFCQTGNVPRSKTRRTGPTALTRNEMVDHFQRTLQGSKWEVLRGWHVFRHSFVSNLAAEGIDQRIIDTWVGHQTEAMRKRYRHLFPSAEAAAIERVFGRQ